jgi:hypothetical protein
VNAGIRRVTIYDLTIQKIKSRSRPIGRNLSNDRKILRRLSDAVAAVYDRRRIVIPREIPNQRFRHDKANPSKFLPVERGLGSPAHSATSPRTIPHFGEMIEEIFLPMRGRDSLEAERLRQRIL